MDWLSVAALLAERNDKPVALVDELGAIRLFNGAMEQALGWRRFEIEGRGFIETCVPAERAAPARHWLSQALRGMLQQYGCELVTYDGRRLRAELELALVGRGGEQGLLVTVLALRPTGGAHEVATGPDLDYQISCEPTCFGTIREIASLGRARTPEGPPLCFQLFHKRDAPCDDCPVLRPARETWPRTTVRRRVDRGDSFEIITAEPVDGALARISVRSIAAHMLAAIHDAKVRGLADNAGLSERERSVLTYLLMGRSLDDIAAILELSRSTVKFHQANILQKLGADSRVDLIRLTGF